MVLDSKLAVEGISKQLTNTVATWASTGNIASPSCSPLESTCCSSVFSLTPLSKGILHGIGVCKKKNVWGDTFMPKILCSIRERSHGVLIGQTTTWVRNKSSLFRHILTLLSALLLSLGAASRRCSNHYSWKKGRRVVIWRVETSCWEKVDHGRLD